MPGWGSKGMTKTDLWRMDQEILREKERKSKNPVEINREEEEMEKYFEEILQAYAFFNDAGFITLVDSERTVKKELEGEKVEYYTDINEPYIHRNRHLTIAGINGEHRLYRDSNGTEFSVSYIFESDLFDGIYYPSRRKIVGDSSHY